MLNKKSKKAMYQPVHWRQSISQSKFSKFSWKNFYIYPLTKWLFSYKNYQSFLTDVLILGSNPIITHLLLVKLYKENIDKFINTGKKINVTILKDNNPDYWSYHTLKQIDYLNLINHKTNLKLTKTEDLFNYYDELYGENSPLEINIIPNQNLSVYYYSKKEEFIDGYVFHLKDKTLAENDYENNMPNIVEIENTIKESYWYLIRKRMNKYSYNIEYVDEKQNNKDNEIKTHLLLANKVYLTSTPYWLNSKDTKEEVEVDNIKFSKTKFENEFSEFSYGSAKEIADDFINFKIFSLNQVINLINSINE